MSQSSAIVVYSSLPLFVPQLRLLPTCVAESGHLLISRKVSSSYSGARRQPVAGRLPVTRSGAGFECSVLGSHHHFLVERIRLVKSLSGLTRSRDSLTTRIRVLRDSWRRESEGEKSAEERGKAGQQGQFEWAAREEEIGLGQQEGISPELYKLPVLATKRKERWEGGEEVKSRGEEESLVSTMGGMFDLERQFTFYGSYHSNQWNIIIHMIFVWPIFFTSLILDAYLPTLAPLPLPGGTLPFQQYMVLNLSFIVAAAYALYYVALDKRAGCLAAAICLGCWVAANAVRQALPWSTSWKIVLASQLVCWAGQIFGHQKFEGRAPALLDNLAQAFLMAPFFVLLEFLQTFGYEPYPGFKKRVEKNVDEAIREYRASKQKKAA